MQLSITQYFSNPNSNKRIVVFGHTHVAKIIPFTNNGIKSIYANSGTWIDDKSGVPGATMNFVVITPQSSGVAGQVPPEALESRFRLVAALVEQFGKYQSR